MFYILVALVLFAVIDTIGEWMEHKGITGYPKGGDKK